MQENDKKASVKHSIEKPILLNFADFSTIFCPRLYFPTKLTLVVARQQRAGFIYFIDKINMEVFNNIGQKTDPRQNGINFSGRNSKILNFDFF